MSKKTTICNAKFGDLGDNGDRGSNMSSKVPYLESPTLICIFTMQLLWGYNDDQGYFVVSRRRSSDFMDMLRRLISHNTIY